MILYKPTRGLVICKLRIFMVFELNQKYLRSMTKYSYVYIRVYVIRDSSSRLQVAFNK